MQVVCILPHELLEGEIQGSTRVHIGHRNVFEVGLTNSHG